jgi:hypothetical protein
LCKCTANDDAGDDNAAAGGAIGIGAGAAPSLLSDSPPPVPLSARGAGTSSAMTMMMDGDGGLDPIVGGALDVATNGERGDRW